MIVSEPLVAERLGAPVKGALTLAVIGGVLGAAAFKQRREARRQTKEALQ